MDEDKDTGQTGGTTPPVEDPAESGAQDQPEEQKPTEEPAEAPAEEPKPEEPAEAPAEEPKPEEPAEAPAEEPKPEEPAEAPAEEPKPEEPAEAPAEEPKPEEPAEAPAEEPKPEEPAEAPAEEKPAEPAAAPAETSAAKSEDCGCPTINEAQWDKQKKTIDKLFYKTWSPRLFYYPFSFSIDLSRAEQGAKNAKYTIPENPMVLDTGGMLWSTIMVEVEGANPEDKNIVSLKGKEFYTKVSKLPWKDMKTDIEALKQELGKEPTELYFWYTSCPKCTDKKEIKTVFLAKT